MAPQSCHECRRWRHVNGNSPAGRAPTLLPSEVIMRQEHTCGNRSADGFCPPTAGRPSVPPLRARMTGAYPPPTTRHQQRQVNDIIPILRERSRATLSADRDRGLGERERNSVSFPSPRSIYSTPIGAGGGLGGGRSDARSASPSRPQKVFTAPKCRG